MPRRRSPLPLQDKVGGSAENKDGDEGADEAKGPKAFVKGPSAFFTGNAGKVEPKLKSLSSKLSLSKPSVEALDADSEMVSCTFKLFQGPVSRVPPLFRRVRTALNDYHKESLARSPSSSLQGRRAQRLRHRAALQCCSRGFTSSSHGWTSVLSTCDEGDHDEGRPKSVPPPSSSSLAPVLSRPHTSDATAVRPRVSQSLLVAGTASGSEGPALEESADVVASSATKDKSKKLRKAVTITAEATEIHVPTSANDDDSSKVRFKEKRSTRFRFDGGFNENVNQNKNKICQLAKSCRRVVEEEPVPQHSPAAYTRMMLQLHQDRHRMTMAAGNEAGGHDRPPGDDVSEAEEGDGDDDKHEGDLTHFQAHELATQLNLPPGQVTDAWRQFKRYDSGNRGLLTPCEFQLLMRSVLRDGYPRVRDIPRDLFHRSHSTDKDCTFSEFLTWLSRYSFSETFLLTKEQQLLRAKARNLQVSIPLVENIKELFDAFDFNSDGLLDYQEFCALFSKLMGTHASDSKHALPDTRVRSFWMEIDTNLSGKVEFDEFLAWYLRYFDKSGVPLGCSPLEEYYECIRPGPKMTRANRFL